MVHPYLKVSRLVLESAQKNLQRHLRLGKSIRSPGGTNQVKSLILATQANPAIARLCRDYRFNIRELSTACVEIIAEKPDRIISGEQKDLLPTSIFCDPAKLEGFLKDLQLATKGKPPVQRHKAIVDCAKKQAVQMRFLPPKQSGRRRRSDQRAPSVDLKIPIVLLFATLLLVGILIAIDLF